ncbi:hypothetical protein BG004_007497 [Podila humilis]|nr:hypothetical protein BG004_007497 [Podila humilis]
MKFSLATIMAVAVLMTPALALPAALPATFDNHRVVRINVQTEEQLALLSANEDALAFDYFTHHKAVGSTVDIRIPPSSFAQFEALKLPYSTLISNLQTVIEQERQEDKKYQALWKNRLTEAKKQLTTVPNGERRVAPAGGEFTIAADVWFNGYHTFADHQAWLQALISNNPSKASGFSAGNSFQGRAQNGVKIGTGPNHVVFHGTQHAREWITTMVVEYIANELVTGTDPRVAGYLSKYTFHIIPVMNPDGFLVTQSSNRMHRKNAQVNGGCLGTDTNRNWGFKWGTGGSSSNPCAQDYKGPSAFSSPEATNIANYLRSLPKVVSYIDFHSYSQLWMVPYGYTGVRPPTYAYMNGLAQKAAAAIKAVSGLTFVTGDIYNTIYQASGNSADYAYSIGVKAPFAVELRDKGAYGFNLPASQIVPSGQETWAAFAAILDNIVV